MNAKNIALGLGAVLLVVGGVIWVIKSDPGRDVEHESEERIAPDEDLLAATAADRLRAGWNSYANANWPAAETLAELAEAAYERPTLFERSARTMGFREVRTVVAGSMVAYVGRARGRDGAPDVIVVAFRGTDDDLDWATNLNVRGTAYPGGSAHRGFVAAYEALRADLFAELEELGADADDRIWVTGHSLGGALALLCVDDLDRSRYGPDGLMTFGQPMVVRSGLIRDLDDRFGPRYARFVNGSDAVARIAPGYEHAGSLVWFTNGGVRRGGRGLVQGTTAERPFGDGPSVAEEPEPMTEREFEAFRDSVLPPEVVPGPDGRVVVRGNSRYVEHHDMALYREKVEEMLRGR